MKRDTRSAYQARAAATERSIDAAIAERKAAEEAEAAKRAARFAERTGAVPFTREELETARAVRTVYGWHRVIRVNPKSITIVGDFGDYRIHEKNVLEVRA